MVSAFSYASIDDEPAAHDVLRALMRVHPDFTDHGRFLLPKLALSALASDPVDLVFVDVEMPGMNGLDFLGNLEGRGLSVLLTAHAEFALEAYELGVRDYLLKPLAPARLEQCLARLRPLLMLQRGSGGGTSAAPLSFASGREYRYVAPADIVAVDADANFSHLVTPRGTVFVSESLKNLEARLEIFGFLRVHKGHLINRVHLLSSRGDELQLAHGLIRPLGRAYRADLQRLLAT